MEYGDTVLRCSVPKWIHYNIDYDYLKGLIKQISPTNDSKVVLIPGQGDTFEQGFRDVFFLALEAQHDRINLFVKSKSGEIERRLDHTNKRVLYLQVLQNSALGDAALSSRMVEKHANINAVLMKIGEEIQDLSRFNNAQCTSFYKLLEKYQRQTKDQELRQRFQTIVIEHPKSLFSLNLGYHLDHYVAVLQAFRAIFKVRERGVTSSPSIDTRNIWPMSANSVDFKRFSSAAFLCNATDEGSNVDFDTAFSIHPLGSQCEKVSYWIYLDHLADVLILLLQYLQPKNPPKDRPSPRDFPYASSIRRQPSTTPDTCCGLSSEDDVGFIALGHLESYAKNRNASSVSANKEATITLQTRAAATVRWASDQAANVVVGPESNQGMHDSERINVARLKRKYLQAFLDTSSLFSKYGKDHTLSYVSSIRQWLTEHKHIKPLVTVCAKRTRMVGFHNSPSSGLWATLDRGIFMKDSVLGDLESNERISKTRKNSHAFPHAVLEVRGEGSRFAELVQALNRSPLVEQVCGFSLEAHAIWTCCNPSAMSIPYWLPLLDKDIRKLPLSVEQYYRDRSSIRSSSSTSNTANRTSARTSNRTSARTSNRTSTRTSTLTISVTDGQEIPLGSPNMKPSTISESELLHSLSSKTSCKKSRGAHSRYPPSTNTVEVIHRQAYWNEYDNPEDGPKDRYYMFIDPKEENVLGQDATGKWIREIKKLSLVGQTTEVVALFPATQVDTSVAYGTLDIAFRSNLHNYGTIVSNAQSSISRPEDCFKDLF